MENNIKEETNIDEIIKKAIEQYDKDKQKKFKDRIFRNTKLLMENYNDFKNHIEYSVSDIKDLQRIVDIDLEENNCDELFIWSIKQSKLKTMIITTHIDIALNILKEDEIREGTPEKFESLKMYYINKKTYSDISEELDLGKNTPRRWINEMTEKLGILLFGVDSINYL